VPNADQALQVALPLPLPRLFDYLAAAPGTPGDIGRRVRVPFGPRELVGVVASVGPAAGDASGLRPILGWLDDAPLFDGELLESLRWLARYTHAPLGEVLATALPAALRRGEQLPDTHAWAWRLTEAGATGLPGLRSGGKPHRLAALLQAGDRDEDALDAAMDDWRGAARALDRRGFAERVAVPASQLAPMPQAGPPPNDEQRAAIACR
jgi:primosomal protein N' (replication factor Y) (superfamily II helicase)